MMMAGLLAFAGAANADEVTVLTAADVTTAEDGSFELVVGIDYDTQETLCGVNFSIKLPEGVDFNTTSTKIAGKKKCIEAGDAIDEDADIEGGKQLQELASGDGYVFAFVDGDHTPFASTHGVLFTFKFKADDPQFKGEGKICNIGLANIANEGWATFGQGNTIADVTFKINDDTNGINEVKNAENNGAIYNVAGQRLEKAAKGLYIQNGKKYVK